MTQGGTHTTLLARFVLRLHGALVAWPERDKEPAEPKEGVVI